jgi:hypothetical protein
MRKLFLAVLLVSVLILGTSGLVSGAVARDVRVTVYNSDIGVVKDARAAGLERGVNHLSMDDIASRIDPTSVRIKIGGRGQVDILEQNFEYDLMSPERLLRKYLEETIDITTEDAGRYKGTLLGFDSRNFVLALDEGGVAVVARDKITDIVLPPGDKGLIVKPTLFWTVNSSREMSAQMEVAYITEGMNWHAEYVATLGERDDTMGLASWVSIDNQSGATYPGATLKLVAGEIHRVAERGIPRPEMAMEMAPAKTARMEERAFFEYHMYALDGTTTIRDKEVKQIQLFPETDVTTEKQYNFDHTKGARVRVVMRFENSEDAGVGMPLPEGKIRVFKADVDGSLEFLGEDRIEHTPKDEEVKIYVGDAFDISVERNRTDFSKVSDRIVIETFEIELANHKEDDVTVKVSEHIYGDWDIRKSSHSYDKIRADIAEFSVPVQADERTVLTYTVRRRF